LDYREFNQVHEFKLRDELQEWEMRKNWEGYKVSAMCEWSQNKLFKMNAKRVLLKIFPEEGSPYNFAGRQGYDIELIIPESYPWMPPYVRFSLKVWHPAVHLLSGCIDRHHHPVLPDDWTPTRTLNQIVQSIRHLLSKAYLEKHFSTPPKVTQSALSAGIQSGSANANAFEKKKKKPVLTKTSSLIKSEEEFSGINLSAYTQFATSPSAFRASIKNYNLKSDETHLDTTNATIQILNKSQLLQKRAARSITDSNDYINNTKMTETRQERASALEKILNIGISANVFEKKCQMNRIQKKAALDKILAEHQLDSHGMTLLDRKAEIEERRNTRIAELEALAGGCGMFDGGESSDLVMGVRMGGARKSLSGPSGSRTGGSFSKMPSLLEK